MIGTHNWLGVLAGKSGKVDEIGAGEVERIFCLENRPGVIIGVVPVCKYYRFI